MCTFCFEFHGNPLVSHLPPPPPPPHTHSHNPQHTISTVSKIFLAFVFVECAALAGVCIWMLCDVTNTYSRLNLIVVLGTSAMLAFFAVDSVMTENKCAPVLSTEIISFMFIEKC